MENILGIFLKSSGTLNVKIVKIIILALHGILPKKINLRFRTLSLTKKIQQLTKKWFPWSNPNIRNKSGNILYKHHLILRPISKGFVERASWLLLDYLSSNMMSIDSLILKNRQKVKVISLILLRNGSSLQLLVLTFADILLTGIVLQMVFRYQQL